MTREEARKIVARTEMVLGTVHGVLNAAEAAQYEEATNVLDYCPDCEDAGHLERHRTCTKCAY